LDACEFRQENINLNKIGFSNLEKEGLANGLENNINFNVQTTINDYEFNNIVENYSYLIESPKKNFNEYHNIENNFIDSFSNYNILTENKFKCVDKLNMKFSETDFLKSYNSIEK